MFFCVFVCNDSKLIGHDTDKMFILGGSDLRREVDNERKGGVQWNNSRIIDETSWLTFVAVHHKPVVKSAFRILSYRSKGRFS